MTSGPMRHPCSDTGRLEGDLQQVENELRRKADSHEVATLNSNVADLARSTGEVSSVCHGLCSRVEACEEAIRQLKEPTP